ncbi:MAG: di-heme oxidoredictase family protein [Aliidongia sp.]
MFSAFLACGVAGASFAQAAPAAVTSVFDPGARPVGNQSIAFAGVVNDFAGLPTPILDFKQPSDGTPGTAGAGLPLKGLAAGQTKFWDNSLVPFGQLVTPNGATDPTTGNPTILGLGPAFNANSCFSCHAFPAIGGSSPPINPQVANATLDGATNTLPPFVTANGPVREARFVTDPGDGLGNGAVRELFSIQGRTDAPAGCSLPQPNFVTQIDNNNVALRIPTPLFGVGFIENTPDEELEANLAAEATAGVGVSGHLNTNGNDQTVTRFGWKAQNKSLLIFAGEAANVEMGLTNELFSTERVPGVDCTGNPLPEDEAEPVPPAVFASTAVGNDVGGGGVASLVSSNVENFAIFMRLNSAPSQCAFDSGTNSAGAALCTPFTSSPNASHIANGHSQFEAVGCAVCHTETLTTGPSPFAPLNNATYHPFSDLAVHDMGAKLADGVTQGTANGKEFRTAPLWGVGQRLFFLHDGRASDLPTAILAHKSSGSEANTVINAFNALSTQNQQDIIYFLRSL